MEKVRLGDLIEVQSGYAFDSSKFNDLEKGMPLIRIRDVGKKETKTFFDGDYSADFVIKKGDFLVGMDGDFRLAKWESVDALLNQRVCRLKITSTNLDKNYLFNFLPSELKKIEDKTSFATVKHLSVKKIQDIQIPLPPLEEQKRIATLLDTADSLRQKDKAVLQKYDALAQSLFLELFGDPVRNEKGWEKKKLSAVGKLDRGKSKHRPRNAPELLNGPYPLIQTGDVANAKSYIKEYKSTYSEIGLKQSKLWPKGTLCITIAANIAKTGILTFEACFPDSVVGFIPNDQTNTDFVQHWISFLQKMLEDSAPESAQKNINLGILKELEIICPPIELQNKFAEQIQLIEKQKELVQENLAKSEALFMGLLGESFKY